MSQSNNDGPAFPEGISLRDWFAGQALAGRVAAVVAAVIVDHGQVDPIKLAQRCYEYADAMLAARAKTDS